MRERGREGASKTVERLHGVTNCPSTWTPPNINLQPCIEMSGRLVTLSSLAYLENKVARAHHSIQHPYQP
jgi:hypothetical protein